MAKQQSEKKVKYNYHNFIPEILEAEHIDRMAVEKVPANSIVLDVGCATGFIGDYLIKKKKCLVYGVEIRSLEIKIARKRLTGIINLDIEEEQIVRKIKFLSHQRKFDVILATSVIEHLKNPASFLKTCKKLLKTKGILIASTPNIAHWSMRLSLLKGNFDYTEYGILDNSHLHFFTIKTFYAFFKENGYRVEELKIDSVGGGFPRMSRLLAKWFPNIFAYQILIIARIK